MICDKCGKDCGNIALDVLARAIENPTPTSCNDTGEPKITTSNETKRMLLCQSCYKGLGLPNVYVDGLEFRDKKAGEKEGNKA